MAVYIHQDISSTFEGDIQLNSNGDIGLADPLETYKGAANFLLRTDFGDYAPNAGVGCNLGSYIGKLNDPSNREQMEFSASRVLKEVLFSPADCDITVVPFDYYEVLCVVNIGGNYLIDNTIKTVNGEVITYTFPYLDGSHLTPITVD